MRRRWLLFALLLGLSLLPWAVLARPGGGGTFSGGSSGGGGGGGGGGGDGGLFIWLIWLCFEHPSIGIPSLILVIIVGFVRQRLAKSRKAWQTSAAAVPYTPQQPAPAQGVSRAALDQVRRIDPAFSLVLFEDFIYFLYAEIQRARATGVAALAAFMAPALVRSLPDQRLGEVRGVVIGALRFTRFSGVHPPMIDIEVEVEANYVEVYRKGGERRFYVVDRMRLQRARSARSRPMDRARTLDCPSCGASLEELRGTQCRYCREELGGGRFDWQVIDLRTLKKEQRGPLLTSNVPEVGTDLPTRVDPGAAQRMAWLAQRDPSFDWGAFQRRLAHVFDALQRGWTARDIAIIRPYVSDSLLQSLMYWIDLYLSERCRAVNEGARILRIDLANVLSDASYDAITVRVFATGLDYTISDDGRLLSGDRKKPRTYSEYWTFIRGVGCQGTPKGAEVCPSCGAPLNVSMVGICRYCNVKVTAGRFDWVLSRIEQDEVYTG